MPSEHFFNSETDLADEIRLQSVYSIDSKMESQNGLNFHHILVNNTDIDSTSPLLSPSALVSSDIFDVNDPFTKPTSAQLDLSGNLTPSHSDSNLASQLDTLEGIADRVSNHGNPSKEGYNLESRLMIHIQEEGTSISSYSSVSSPEILSPSHSGITSPNTFLNQDTSTQLSLIQHAEDLNLHSETTNLDSDDVWTLMQDGEPMGSAFKMEEQPDTAPSIQEDSVICREPFTVGSAMSSSQFIFKHFGQSVPGMLTACITSPAATSTSLTGSNGTTITSATISASPVSVSMRQPPRRLKTPSLSLHFPAKQAGYELKILAQPEEQHRARYMTEGSRGPVKQTSGQGHPILQLLGYKQKATLQVFVGSETNRVKPHGFYQACKVCGKNSTPCSERDIDGTTVIEMDFEPDEDMKISIDCVGILKLRNADVEQRIGLAKSKKRSTKARLVFRVCLPKADGSTLTLQVASSPILCTQPIGQPEICKKSLKEAPVSGGEELFIIGKNFMKGTKVLFQEMANENSKEVVWEKIADIDTEFFQQTHLICQVPEYDRCATFSPVSVVIVVECCGRVSEPHSFAYTPVPIKGGRQTPCLSGTHTPVEAKMEIKREVIHIPMETETEHAVNKNLSFVSPVALELNKLIQQGQQDGIFKIPAGLGLPTSETLNSPTTIESLLSNSSNSSQREKNEVRKISSMDFTAAPEVAASQHSSISANAPMLTSLLVRDPETIQSPTLVQQSPSSQQTTAEVAEFVQNSQPVTDQQLNEYLQQSPLGQQTSSIIPQTASEISQFLQDSPLGQLDVMPQDSADDQTTQNTFLERCASPPSSTDVTSFLQQPTLNQETFTVTPSSQSSSGFLTIESTPLFIQQNTSVASPVVSQYLQQSSLNQQPFTQPSSGLSEQQATVNVAQFLQQLPTVSAMTSVNQQSFSTQISSVGDVSRYLQSTPTVNSLTFTVLPSSSPLIQQSTPIMVQSTPIMVQQVPQMLGQQQDVPMMQQQPALIVQPQSTSVLQQETSSMIQQQASPMMLQVTSPLMQQQASPAMQQESSPMMQQQASPSMQQQQESPAMQRVSSPLMQQQQASPAMQQEASTMMQQQLPSPAMQQEATLMMQQQLQPTPVLQQVTPPMMQQQQASPAMQQVTSPVMQQEPLSMMQQLETLPAIQEETLPMMQQQQPTAAMQQVTSPMMQQQQPIAAMQQVMSPLMQQQQPTAAMQQVTSPLMQQQQPTATMQQVTSPFMQQQSSPSMPQQQASLVMQQDQQQASPVMIQVTSPMMQQQQASPVMIQVTSPMMQQQQPSPAMQEVTLPLMQQPITTIGQQNESTQQVSTPQMQENEQQASATRSLEQASQAFDQMLSKCQQADSVQQNGGFLPTENNTLPSISLQDVDDILKNNMS